MLSPAPKNPVVAQASTPPVAAKPAAPAPETRPAVVEPPARPAAKPDTRTDAASAAALLQREASAIKRPVVEWPDGAITVGFAPEDWAERLG